ncbi:histidine-specific methyltransferase [Aspergillus carlsbadensis]|nr:histidine-specific methyltransferase [Aspergillus carlsbadensis]
MLENIIQPRFGIKTHSFHHAPTGQIIDIRSDKRGVELRESLQQSIRNESSALPDLLLWDELGLRYFEDVTYCQSYYLTREEVGLLQLHCREIAARIPAGSMLVELGSGNLRKTKILLDALEELGRPVDYFALDVSSPELQRTLRPVSSGIYRHIRCFGLLGTYDDGRTWLQHPDLHSRPKTILYLGSTLGNFKKADAAEFLASFAQADCSVLLGLDGCKDEERVLKAYNDPDGINHRFVRNGLRHANRILGHEAFDLNRWRVAGDWDAENGVHNQSYLPRVDVSLEGVRIPAGRKLLAVRSHKYDAEDREVLCRRAGLHVLDSWPSEHDYNLLYLTSK